MLTFDTPQGRFNFRVAGIAIVDGHALIHRDYREDLWVFPGGRVESMEPAAAALKRELREETGLDFEIRRLLWVAENFFVYDRVRYHEICFLFEMAPPPELTPRQPQFRGSEGAIHLEFRWVPLGELSQYRLVPEFAAARLWNLPASAEHIVQGGFDNRDPR